ncbi:hypothetical protein K501DRAFT_320834 [Backusella circina FSU 941]|nr:hypothetical protein K501DRAFT_320834 [Backusella circina FSU 941]
MAHAISESVEENNNLSDSTETLRNNPTNSNNQVENWDLNQFREGFANGTRSAEAYFQKVSNDIFDGLKRTINGLSPMDGEEEEEEEGVIVDQDRRLSRKEAYLAKIYTSQDIYLNDPIEEDQKLYNTFISGFHIDDYKDEISSLLEKNPNLKETMHRLVPVQVTYNLFWKRYFYYVWKLDQDEMQRNSLDSWDDDASDDSGANGDDEMTDTKASIVNEKKETSDTDFSHISGPPSTEASFLSPSLRSTEDEWVKADRKRSDDDSDWDFCFEVLIAFLEDSPAPKPIFPNDSYPLFVTWNVESGDELVLRGCIGNFNPMPLHKGLEKYALISALEDRRFRPISLKEIPKLHCAVSLLTDFEEANDYLDWEIGKHGIWIEFKTESGHKTTATYLPEVMSEQGWTKEEAIDSLLRKGGYRGSFSSTIYDTIVLTRYQSQKMDLAYKDL